MGGNALGIEIPRINKQDYNQLLINFRNLIDSSDIDYTYFKVVPSYKNKPDFGDVDILISCEENYPLLDKLKELMPNAIYNSNGGVYSFHFENFQVDIINTPKDIFVTSAFYYSYNDMGNLLGKLFHKFGLKFGQDGLTYIVRDEDKIFSTITVSKDPIEILEFLGLDFNRWLEGFDELTDIFDFIIGSKYFARSVFEVDNLIARKRTAKRPSYYKFLEYIKDSEDKYTDTFDKDKMNYIELINSYFPEFQFKINQQIQLLEHRKFVRQFLNGKIVMDRTGLKGGDLGGFITYINDNNLSEMLYQEYMKSTNENIVQVHIDKLFRKYKEEKLVKELA